MHPLQRECQRWLTLCLLVPSGDILAVDMVIVIAPIYGAKPDALSSLCSIAAMAFTYRPVRPRCLIGLS
jgi:hypothetical protein